MKSNIYKLLLPVFIMGFYACGESKKEETQKVDAMAASPAPDENEKPLLKDARNIGGEKSPEQLSIEAAQEKMATSTHPLAGNWVGNFGKNKINIAIYEVNENEVKGHSVCAGNYRALSGTIQYKKANPHHVILKEPGDDPYDGTFEFQFDPVKMTVEGKWTPFKAEGNTPKTFTLKKRIFEYKSGVGEYPESSIRELTEDDVINLNPESLTYMRNEIYARHGYSFKNKEMRYTFEPLEWYMPMGVDIRSQLTDVEVKNIDLIYRYEKYYEENYDSYGR